MTKEEIIRNLKYTMEKHKNDTVSTFGTNISVMCKDILDFLEQEPKIGQWIDHQEGKWIYAKCSECGTVHDTKTNYCPNCGTEMGVSQVSEDIDYIIPKKIVGRLISIDVLDKISAEVAALPYISRMIVLDIIDKYKAESEVKK